MDCTTKRKANANGRGTIGDAIAGAQYYEDLLIGAVLVNPHCAASIDIKAGDFADRDLAEIWMLIPALVARGVRPDDMAVLRDELRLLGIWGAERVNAVRVGKMLEAMPHNAGYYADRVRDAAKRRRLQRLHDVASMADDPTHNVDDLLIEAADIAAQDRPAAIGKPMTYATLIDGHNALREPVVEGLLRRGETCNVIASPKVGKSWLVAQLGFAVATGREWLGFATAQGKVLLVDNELHPETLSHRLGRVASAMAIDPATAMLDVLPIRGRGIDIHGLPRLLAGVEPGAYRLIVLDALYRFLPSGTSENDNAAIMHVYNALDRIAATTASAIAIVHHTSKGDQSGKAQTDVGAGAGSIARAADTHLTIRPHESEGLAVLEAVTRSWAQPAALSIRYEYPIWTASVVEPELRRPKTAQDRRQESIDDHTKKAIIDALAGGRKLSARQLRTATQFGQGRVDRGLALLGDRIHQKRVKRKTTGKPAEVYWLGADGTRNGTRDGSYHQQTIGSVP